jgi:3-oxoadipate enol-lactonase
MPFVDSDGTRIAYTDSGGSKPPVIFSHGFLMDATMFRANVAALSDSYRCITWDQRGHGDTGFIAEAFDYWRSARDLLNLMDYLDVTSAILVGMSQGGFISLRAALLQPERVDALVLIDTRSGVDAPEVVAAFEQVDAEWSANGAKNMKENLAHLLGLMNTSDYWFEKWDRIGTSELSSSIDALARRDDITDRLSEIAMPALVIHGEADVAIDSEHGRLLAQALPECRGFYLIPNAGHAPNMTHPEAVNPLIREFLSTVFTPS